MPQVMKILCHLNRQVRCKRGNGGRACSGKEVREGLELSCAEEHHISEDHVQMK